MDWWQSAMHQTTVINVDFLHCLQFPYGWVLRVPHRYETGLLSPVLNRSRPLAVPPLHLHRRIIFIYSLAILVYILLISLYIMCVIYIVSLNWHSALDFLYQVMSTSNKRPGEALSHSPKIHKNDSQLLLSNPDHPVERIMFTWNSQKHILHTKAIPGYVCLHSNYPYYIKSVSRCTS